MKKEEEDLFADAEPVDRLGGTECTEVAVGLNRGRMAAALLLSNNGEAVAYAPTQTPETLEYIASELKAAAAELRKLQAEAKEDWS